MADATPASRQLVMSSLFLAASVAAIYYMRFSPASFAAAGMMGPITESRDYRFPGTKILLRRIYTGVGGIDVALSFFVAAFLPGATGWNGSFQLLQAYFLFFFFSILAVWSVEAGRSRNAHAAIRFTSLWAIPYQTIGGAIVVPLWFMTYGSTTSRASYWELHHHLPLASAKALLPALMAGYLIPTILVFWPFQDINTLQFMLALWQLSPFFVNAMWWILSKLFDAASKSMHPAAQVNVQYVKAIYIVAFFVAAASHVAIVAICATSDKPDITLRTVFMPVQRGSWSLDEALHFIFQYDFWIIAGASTTWCYLAAWDLRRLNLTSAALWEAVALQTLCSITLGPGAALSATWYWREGRMEKRVSTNVKRS